MDAWRYLPHSHWPKLFAAYNISLEGKFITILPTIHLHAPVAPDDVMAMRHANDAQTVLRLFRYDVVPDSQGHDLHVEANEATIATMTSRNRTLTLEKILQNLQVCLFTSCFVYIRDVTKLVIFDRCFRVRPVNS